jgi:hypothetical protein
MLAYATLPRRRIEAGITGLVLVVHLANASIAAWMGYLSPDSWYYLRLAKSLYVNGYPSVDGTSYSAIWPFGYPLLLALVSPGLDVAQAAAVSKFANASLWISAYFVLRSLRISPVLAGALVLTPFSLQIAAITWSENLMILALILTLAGVDRLQRETSRSQAASMLFLLAALLLGIVSRYVFGYVILVLMGAYLLSFHKALRPHILVVFAASACFFVLYLWVNARLTGYSTGIERIATTNSTSYLVFTFAKATSQLVLSMLLPAAAIGVLTVRHWRLNSLVIMTALTGVAYVAVMAYIRWHWQFDPFNQRLLGPGWFLLTLALILSAGPDEPDARRPLGSIGLLCLALGAVCWVHGKTAWDLIRSGEAWTSPTQALRDHLQAFHRKDGMTSVISVYVPSPRVSTNADPLYYDGLRAFFPMSAPYGPRETLDEFRARVLASGTDIDHCVVDFSQLASEEQLSEILDGRYRTTLKEVEARFDTALAGGFRRIFRPRELVPCRDLLRR